MIPARGTFWASGRTKGGTVIGYFVFFLVSGFCGILYELIWLRLAMAQFGVTTPLLSTVLSMFMAGLGLGSLAAGRFLRGQEENDSTNPLRLYSACDWDFGSCRPIATGCRT
jgi:spermidine synthase